MATLPHEEGAFTDGPRPVEESRRSTLTLLRHVILNLTQVVEDGTELVGASIREELLEFREDMARHALSLVAVVIGGVLVSAGLAMLVSEWIGSWPITLLIFGAIYIAFAVGLRLGHQRRDKDPEAP